MKTIDLITTALGNTFRSRTRTTLTVLAIFVGAFTLTLTNGLGTGINNYVDSTVDEFGSSDVMTVVKTPEDSSGFGPVSDGPTEYDPDAVSADTGGPDAQTVLLMDSTDLTTIAIIPGVVDVEPVQSVAIDFVQYEDQAQYVATINSSADTQTMQFAEGVAPDANASEAQVALPQAMADAWTADSEEDVIGGTATIGVSDALGNQSTITATVTGVTEAGLLGSDTEIVPNDALLDQAAEVANAGLSADRLDQFATASLWFSPDATDAEIADLQAALADAGYTGSTLADQLGAVTAVIDAVVLVLNVFAAIALIAAGFGIVNTLLMSVQERTREIGLMKAMGMGSRRVFSLFSLEAALIGLIGAAIGTAVGMAVGVIASDALASGFLSALPGLTLIAFDPITITITIAVVVAMAVIAGAMPAARAARANPVDSLRYE